MLKEIEDRLNAITPGPWKYKYYEPYEAGIESTKGQIPGINVFLDDAPVPDYNRLVDNNAKFIAHAPTDIARLLKVVKLMTNIIKLEKNCNLDLAINTNNENSKKMFNTRAEVYQLTLDKAEAILKGVESEK